MSDLHGKSTAYQLFEYDPPPTEVKEKLDKVVELHADQCKRLIEYATTVFERMQAVETSVFGESIPILFALDGIGRRLPDWSSSSSIFRH
ncbi:MAG: hypothetical protein WDO15_28335 [Bacteroidota bacterium]